MSRLWPSLAAGAAWALWAVWRAAAPLSALGPDGPELSWVLPGWPLALGLAAGAWLAQEAARRLAARWLRGRGLESQQAAGAARRAWLASIALVLVPVLELAAPLIGLGPLALLRDLWWAAPLVVLLAALGAVAAAAPARPEGTRPGPSPWLVFAAGLIFCAAMGLNLHRLARDNGPFIGGDEPRYLLLAHSLAVDHDLDVARELRLREQYLFARPGQVVIDHQHWMPWGALYSKFRPGLPLLLAPFHAWGLLTGVDPWLAARPGLWLLWAWMLAELFALARRATGRWGPALAASGAAAGAMPGLIYSSLIFPGAAAAAFIVAALSRLHARAARGWPALLLAGVCVGYLGWLHERFLPLCAVLLLLALLRRPWRDRAGLIAFWLPALAGLAMLSGYFMLLYGTPWPSASVHAQGSFLAANPWQSLSGVLLDAGEGFFTYAPIWIAGLAGLVWLARRAPALGIGAAGLALALYLSAGLFQDWHAGIGPPARYLVPLAPLLALGLAAGLAWGGRRFWLAAAFLACLSLPPALHVWRFAPSVYGHRVVLDGGAPFAALKAFLPTWIAGHASPAQNAALAVLAFAAVFGVVLWLCRGPARASRPAAGAAALLLLAGVWAALGQGLGPGVLTVAGPNQRLAQWRALAGLTSCSGAFSPLGPGPCRALSLALPPERNVHPPGRRLPGGGALAPAGAKAGLFVWGQYLNLPAGRYRAEFRLAGGGDSAGWVEASADGGRRVLARLDFSVPPASGPAALAFADGRPLKGVELRTGSAGRGALAVEGIRLQRALPPPLGFVCGP